MGNRARDLSFPVAGSFAHFALAPSVPLWGASAELDGADAEPQMERIETYNFNDTNGLYRRADCPPSNT